MADLKLDTDFLCELGTDLRTVASEFEHANAHSDYVADAVGHGGLAERVRDFAHNWDDRRKKMMGNIQQLGESAYAVGDAFDQLEDELVRSLRGEG
ncbi:MAG: hypothetical protein ACRCYQ_15145 [Nocardioides sp.]